MILKYVLPFLFTAISANSENEKKIDHLLEVMEEGISRSYKIPRISNSYKFIPASKNYIDYGTYDNIIVGAGSAGAVIANRLSEDKWRRILLLEAGGNSSILSEIPGMMLYVVGLEENWNYFSVPVSTSCLGMKGQQCAIPRGKGLGGSSTINALMFTRGNKRDYNKWAAQGNYGWSYKDVLPYFKKSENFVGPLSEYRGKNGYLNIEVAASNLQTEMFFEANRELGRKELTDYNGKDQIGFGRLQLNTFRGSRHSTSRAFLLPILNRSNLETLTDSFVIKILISRNKRAFGVLFSRNGKLYVAKSRKDIVISAGSINSPQLLMLSGIGPKDHLKELGIRVVQDLPVGKHLEDHPIYSYLEFLTNFTVPEQSTEELLQGYLNSDGSLSNPFNVQGMVFTETKLSTESGYPDVEFATTPSINKIRATDKYWNLNQESIDAVNRIDEPNRTVTYYVVGLHPKSRGFLRLKSADPFEYPLINLNLLSDEGNEDIELMYQGIQMMLELLNTEALKRIDVKLKDSTHPACKSLEYLSRDYWYCQLRYLAASLFHPIATCKMGPHPKRGAVVSPELKVFGITNLRVADASVMPSSISGHTNAPTIMIAEKAADLIRNVC
ncbi:hypothetical protein RI129_007897 [Pyrocoelia pectoralis]|uniref:Glucose-methanol-choline oxidoreductase N-terminal domain-containing protein n=1 Tax=Pyrocoelia pectoralis TaxID=417401 RepID=A0AAN7VAI0_9COLE